MRAHKSACAYKKRASKIKRQENTICILLYPLYCRRARNAPKKKKKQREKSWTPIFLNSAKHRLTKFPITSLLCGLRILTKADGNKGSKQVCDVSIAAINLLPASPAKMASPNISNLKLLIHIKVRRGTNHSQTKYSLK